jgi:hypothetical protein
MSKVKKDASLWIILQSREASVGDLREFVEELNKLGFPNWFPLEDCVLSINYANNIEFILDGELSPMIEKYDILLPLVFENEDT